MQMEFRYRGKVGESIEARHREVLARLSSLGHPFGIRHAQIPDPDVGEGLSADVDLTAVLPPGVRGHLHYVYRGSEYLRDSGLYDDLLVIDLGESTIPYPLAVEGFRSYIEAWSPYRAHIVFDQELALDDWDEVAAERERTGVDVDGRDTVFRIWPVSFFDDMLCSRAFGLGAAEVEIRLKKLVPEVYTAYGGVLIIGGAEPFDRATIYALDKKMRAALA